MIPGFDKEKFAEVLHTHLSPAAPIQSPEYLYGREVQMREIEQALCAPGRSVFIYGDRGVGKTSLAQTVAHTHQSATHDPIFLACAPETTFAILMQRLLSALESPSSKGKPPTEWTGKVKVGPVGLELGRKTTALENQRIATADLDLNLVVRSLQEAADRRGGSTVTVIDEFDRIKSEEERAHFADLIKQIGDQRLSVRFIFCGVGDSLDKLLGAHESCYRYLAGVQVQRLGWEPRWNIIDRTAEALGVRVIDHPRFRIAAISDGFPHYVHLVSEKLFWEMFNDEQKSLTPTRAHYQEAVAAAVLGIEQHLKRTYDKATIRGTRDYEHILWAVADHADLIRSTNDIYESYRGIWNDAEHGELLDRSTVVSRLSTLKTDSCGRILTSDRRGFYQYRESMMRGYVRLRAAEQGIELAVDYAAGPEPKSAWRPRRTKRTFQWRPPDDIYEN